MTIAATVEGAASTTTTHNGTEKKKKKTLGQLNRANRCDTDV